MKNIFFIGRTGNKRIKFIHKDLSTLFILSRLCVINSPIIPDRFGILNNCEFKIFPKVVNINNIYDIPLLSFKDCIENKIMSIIGKSKNENKKIYIMWSGGVDSTLVVSSFLNSGYKNIGILYNKYSVSEYPNFFIFLKKNNLDMFDFGEDIYNIKRFSNDIIVNGNIGDFIEYPTYDSLKKYYANKFNTYINPSNNWKDEFLNILNNISDINGIYNIDRCIEDIENYSNKLGIDLYDFRTFHFLLMFCIKYTIGANRLSFLNNNYDDAITFFDSLYFQKYALSNKEIQRKTTIYKYEWKKIINSVYKDSNYFIEKEKDVTYIGKISNPGFVVYDKDGMHDFGYKYTIIKNILRKIIKEEYDFYI